MIKIAANNGNIAGHGSSYGGFITAAAGEGNMRAARAVYIQGQAVVRAACAGQWKIVHQKAGFFTGSWSHTYASVRAGLCLNIGSFLRLTEQRSDKNKHGRMWT